MNRPYAAQVSASSQPVRQMLFVLLAALVTLVAVQQYGRWVAAQPDQHLLPSQTRLVDTARLNPASSRWVGPQTAQNIERVQATEAAPHAVSWVF